MHFDGAFLAEDLFDDGAWVASTDIKEEEEEVISAAIGVSVLNLTDDDLDDDLDYTPSPFLVPPTTSPPPLSVPDAYKVTDADIIDIRTHAIPFSYSFSPDEGYMVIFPTKEESLKYSALEVRTMLPNSGKQTITIGYEIDLMLHQILLPLTIHPSSKPPPIPMMHQSMMVMSLRMPFLMNKLPLNLIPLYSTQISTTPVTLVHTEAFFLPSWQYSSTIFTCSDVPLFGELQHYSLYYGTLL